MECCTASLASIVLHPTLTQNTLKRTKFITLRKTRSFVSFWLGFLYHFLAAGRKLGHVYRFVCQVKPPAAWHSYPDGGVTQDAGRVISTWSVRKGVNSDSVVTIHSALTTSSPHILKTLLILSPFTLLPPQAPLTHFHSLQPRILTSTKFSSYFPPCSLCKC